MLVLEKQDKQDGSGQSYQMFYAVVQLIGTKKEAEQFVYRWPIIFFKFKFKIDFKKEKKF
jgi:hypothetical protein